MWHPVSDGECSQMGWPSRIRFLVLSSGLKSVMVVIGLKWVEFSVTWLVVSSGLKSVSDGQWSQAGWSQCHVVSTFKWVEILWSGGQCSQAGWSKYQKVSGLKQVKVSIRLSVLSSGLKSVSDGQWSQAVWSQCHVVSGLKRVEVSIRWSVVSCGLKSVSGDQCSQVGWSHCQVVSALKRVELSVSGGQCSQVGWSQCQVSVLSSGLNSQCQVVSALKWVELSVSGDQCSQVGWTLSVRWSVRSSGLNYQCQVVSALKSVEVIVMWSVLSGRTLFALSFSVMAASGMFTSAKVMCEPLHVVPFVFIIVIFIHSSCTICFMCYLTIKRTVRCCLFWVWCLIFSVSHYKSLWKTSDTIHIVGLLGNVVNWEIYCKRVWRQHQIMLCGLLKVL